MTHATSTWQGNDGTSVLGLTPREPITMVVRESRHGHVKYEAYACTGDGSKPGSLLRFTSGNDPKPLFDELIEVIEGR